MTNRHRRLNSARSPWVVGGLAILSAGLVCAAPAALADDTNEYQLGGQAESLRIVLIDPGAPLFPQIAASPYAASATLNSLGQSSSTAGAPYSPDIAALPGTVNGIAGATGQLPPVPPVPGYVFATYPSRPTDSQKQAPYAIEALAAGRSASGSVAIGLTNLATERPTSFSQATTELLADGTAVVNAAAGVDLLNLGGVLDLGNVSSFATISKAAGKASTYASETNLGTVRLLGPQVDAFGPSAQQLTPQLIPALNQALESSGVSVAYLPATYVYADGSTSAEPLAGKVIQSVDSGALQVTMKGNVPSQGDVSLTLVLGRVSVGATNGALESPTLGGGIPGFDPTPDGALGALGAPGLDGVSLGTGVLPPTSVPDQSTPAAVLAERRMSVANADSSARGIYLAVVLSGVIAFGVAQTMRLLAVGLAFGPKLRGN